MIKQLAFCLILAGPLLAVGGGATAADSKSEGEKLYMEMHRVLTHPRCLNCHPERRFAEAGR